MSTLKVYDKSGAEVKSLEVPKTVQLGDKGAQAVHDVVVALQAGIRRGTASTLGKGAVAGSNRKPWRQKGTGQARAGYRQSPVWRGGGIVFGPKPRDYAIKVNKKVQDLAFRRAVSDKVAGGAIKVMTEIAVPQPKTKLFVGLLKALKITGPALFVVESVEQNLRKASRNVPGIEVVRAADVNVYQMLRYPVAVVTEKAWKQILERVAA